MAVQVKQFESQILESLPIPDGKSLEEKVNVFLNTLDEKDVLSVVIGAFSSAKYGVKKTYIGTVIYILQFKERMNNKWQIKLLILGH